MYFDAIVSVVDMIMISFLFVFILSGGVLLFRNRDLESEHFKDLSLHVVLSFVVVAVTTVVIIFSHDYMRSFNLTDLIFKIIFTLGSLVFCLAIMILISKIHGMRIKHWLPWYLGPKDFTREYIVTVLKKYLYLLIMLSVFGVFAVSSIIGVIELLLNGSIT